MKTHTKLKLEKLKIIDAEASREAADESEFRDSFGAALRKSLKAGNSRELAYEQLAYDARVRAAKRRARRLAQAVGLRYWPALLPRAMRVEWNNIAANVDPAAFVIAEQILARKAGGFWGESLRDMKGISHGGWDSHGCHGLAAVEVAEMWIAAGCRDTPKFRAQVLTGHLAKKGESLPQFLNFARGKRWALRWPRYSENGDVSRKALAALGRLSAELRHAAMRGMEAGRCRNGRARPCAEGTYRIRDLRWIEVARIQRLRTVDAPIPSSFRELGKVQRPAALPEGAHILRAAMLPPKVAEAQFGLQRAPRSYFSLPLPGGRENHPLTWAEVAPFAGRGNTARDRDQYFAELISAPFPLVWREDDNVSMSVHRTAVRHGWRVHYGLEWPNASPISLVESPNGRTFHSAFVYNSDRDLIGDAIRNFRRQDAVEKENRVEVRGNVSCLVFREDSYRAGNCDRGTEAFLAANGWEGRWYVPLIWLADSQNQRAINAAKVAAARLDAIMGC